MRLGDTIVARASAAGSGRRAVVRVSGPGTSAVLGALGVDDPGARWAGAVRLRVAAAGGSASLPTLMLRFVAPRSYTGEDAAEFVLPNNATLVDRVMGAMLGVEGVRAAVGGEFSARAFLGGRLSLVEADAVAALVAAATTYEVEAAQRVMSGEAGARFGAWAQEVASLLALVEAGIDFAEEEDVVAISAGALSARLARLTREMRSWLGEARSGLVLDGLPLVVLAGRPNAGKSSLFNALLGSRRMVASSVAGSTRDVVMEEVVVDEAMHRRVMLADLPGLDADARDEAGRASQEAARRALDRADLVLWCDERGEFADVPGGEHVVRVRTKADGHVGSGDIAVCSVDGWHVEHVRRLIAARALASRSGVMSGLIPRHRGSVACGVEALEAALGLVRDQPCAGLMRAEEVASWLRRGLDEVGEVSGRITPDDVLGRIFATFCIGK